MDSFCALVIGSTDNKMQQSVEMICTCGTEINQHARSGVTWVLLPWGLTKMTWI